MSGRTIFSFQHSAFARLVVASSVNAILIGLSLSRRHLAGYELLQSFVVVDELSASSVIFRHKFGVEFCQCFHLVGRSLPHPLARTLQHHGRNALQSRRTDAFEVFAYAEIVLVFDIGVEDFIPHLIVDGIGFHHFPSERVLHHFFKSSSSTLAAFHLFFEISGIEHRSATFHPDGFFHFLHSHIIVIAIVS